MRLNKRNPKRTAETAIHAVFLLIGLIAVACVLMITIYLIAAGIPATN